ncbi:replication-relaxation family protein [Laceyella putida]
MSTAKREEPGRRTRRDYRRKRLPKSELSLDWAKANVDLTERKKKMLEILAQRRLLTIEQLEYFHPDFGHQSQSQLLLRRDINKLYEVYLVDKALKKPIIQWDGTVKKTMVISMGELGSQYAGWAKHHQRIKHRDGQVVLPATAHHILRIHDMEIQTRELMKEMGVEVKAWAYECGNRILKHSNGLNPDVFCMLYDQSNGKHYTLFLEYDTGKDDYGRRKKFPNLTKKIDRYREVKGWKDWYERPISSASENKFPHIFFVTEEPKRFPELPKILESRGLDHTVCLQQDYLSQLEKFIQGMRS